MKILVTGANGFVGGHLVEHLLACGHEVTSVVRRGETAHPATDERVIADIGPDTDWNEVLKGHDAVIHLAARVHVMNETAADPLEEFRRVNTLGTIALANAASAQGVTRFIFLSSVKVNGEGTEGRPFTAFDRPDPQDPYGASKLEAEELLVADASRPRLQVVVVRTPLVYGPGVGGNFLRLLRLVRSGVPLPLGAVHNRRTMMAVWNLVDILEKSLAVTTLGGAVILAGDSESLSTPDLMRKIASAMNIRSRVFWFPVVLLVLGGKISRKATVVQRLSGSLEVASGSNIAGWRWEPPIGVDEAIQRTIGWYENGSGGSR